MKKQKQSSAFYVSVDQHKGKILVSEIDAFGERHYYTQQYKPKAFVVGKKDDPQCVFQSIHGDPMKKKVFKSIYDYRDFLENVEDKNLTKVVGGTIGPIFQYISEKYHDLNPDYSKIRVCYLDIETGPDPSGGFADPYLASGEILSIALKFNTLNKFIVFGCKEFQDTEDIVYVKCKNEVHLLHSFLKVWQKYYPDVITGWFISTFDMPYLFTRISLILGEEEAQKLSPFNVAYLRDDLDPIRKDINEERKVLFIAGIQEIDYIRLYKKFATKQKETESNALNYIAELELGEKKLEYEGNLFKLYENDYKTFIEYNVQDVRLVERLETKLQLLYLAYSLAYYAKVTFRDVFFQVRMWDAIIYNYLLEKNVVIPFSRSSGSLSGKYSGAYVKDPQVGMKDWIVSFDVTSLYPHLILQFNISPDTFVGTVNEINGSAVEAILNRNLPESCLEYMKNNNVCMAANSVYFTNEKTGFLPELIAKLFEERKKYKKLYLENKKLYEETKDENYKTQSKLYDILQNTKKICLNSAYGAMGNQYFRFYNVFLAEAVTLSGQLVIRWIENACNEFLNEFFKTEGRDYCIASDTDSVYLDLSLLKGKVKTSDDVDNIIRKDLLKHVNDKLIELKNYLNCKENKIELKREVIADRGVFIAKKRYCLNVLDNEGVKYEKPHLKMMGVEAIKSSTPKICRELLKEAIRIILQNDEKTLQQFYRKIRDEYQTHSIDEIAFPRGINGLDKYTFSSKSIPIHVFGALKFNSLIKDKKLSIEEIKNGDKIKFFYLREPNWLNSHVLSYPSNRSFPTELSDIREIIDYDVMIEKSFLEPLKIITEKINWNVVEKETILDLFD